MGLLYKPKTPDITLNVHSDASYNSDYNTGRSFLGYCMKLNDCCWAWHSSLSKTIPKSTQHAKIIAELKCLDSTRWASFLLEHTNVDYTQPIPFHTDNKAQIKTMTNPQTTKGSQHIRPHDFDLHDAHDTKVISFKSTSTNELCADILTKALNEQPFQKHRSSLSISDPPILPAFSFSSSYLAFLILEGFLCCACPGFPSPKGFPHCGFSLLSLLNIFYNVILLSMVFQSLDKDGI